MKKEKIISFIIFSIFCIPLSWIMAIFVHCNLRHITFTFELIKTIEIEKELILLFFLCLLFCLLSLFILFVLGKTNYMQSEVDRITNNIITPKAVGQGQHGTSRWLTDKEFKKNFNYIEIERPKVKSKSKLLNKISSRIYLFKRKIFKKKKKEKIYKSGGVVVGFEKKNNKEKIYYIDDNMHSLIVGATRSRKNEKCSFRDNTECYGLANESMIISDPKSELYHYTSEFLESLGYKIITIDFRNPLKSSRYNFLQPVIDAVNNNDYRKAEELCWDITQALVGNEDSKMEKIWKDGEMSVIAGAIMSVVFDNKNNPQYQNLTNVYAFINEMCKPVGNTMPINKYIETLKAEHPASSIFRSSTNCTRKNKGKFLYKCISNIKIIYK